jgi:signal transduction histidine kinase
MAMFQVAARTLIHLGSELITSDPIAIYELIKNAIDAKSPNVNIHFVFPFPQDDLNELAERWLQLRMGNPHWKEQVSDSLIYFSRLQREEISTFIQNHIDKFFEKIRSAKTPSDAAEFLYHINYIEVIDSGIGMSKKNLNDVFLRIGTEDKLNREHEGQPLLGNKGIGRLSMMRLGKCSSVTSWQSKDNVSKILFDWRKFELPDKLISDISFPLIDIKVKNIKSSTGTRVRITHLTRDWTKRHVKSSLIESFLRRLRNPFEQNRSRFPINVFYNTFNVDDRMPISKMSSELWNAAQKSVLLLFLPQEEIPLTLTIKNEDGIDSVVPYKTDLKSLAHQFDCTEKELKKIGKLSFRLRWYNRKLFKTKIKDQGLSNRSKELLKELNVWSGGIAIYRDGFRIGYSGSFDDKDWFEIDKKALRGKGFTVNRIQMVGVLEISKKENPLLQDRSNREGLLDTRQLDLVNQIINNIALKELREVINEGKENEAFDSLQHIIEEGAEHASEKLSLARQTVTSLSKSVTKEQKQSLDKINEELHFVANKIAQFEQATSYIKETREDILELAGTGTMMHVVMHELVRTTGQTRELLKKIAKKSDIEISELLIKLENEIKTIHVRLRQFDPVSTSGRHRKLKFDLVGLIATILNGYKEKFKRHAIKAYLTIDDSLEESVYTVNMVRGFITIALENLISNSFYWLKQDKIFSHLVSTKERAICIDIDTLTNTISISDTGPGIVSADRDRIFTPGFTTKKSEREGKGFGLFIAREVTKYHEGNLYLDISEDTDGRLRTFILELPN